MRKSGVTMIRREFANREALFLKDPKSDLFIILNEKIYPLHKNFLQQVEYFATADLGNEKVHMVDPSLDSKWFESVIGYYYGKQLQFFRNWEISKLLHVVSYLKAKKLQKNIVSDIITNFDEYGFFLLMSIAENYKIKQLKQRCEEELILMGFEQLNYNRYDLFQVDRTTFQEIIKLHQLLKINQNIVGLRDIDLKRIINQYCKTNNISKQQIQKLLASYQNQIKLQKEQEQNQNPINRKRNASTPNEIEALRQDTQDISHSCQVINVSANANTNQNQNQNEDQNKQLIRLRLINSQIQQKNNKLIQQIENVKHVLEKSTANVPKIIQIQGIDEKFKKFQRLSREQQAKYLSLKAEMQKLSPSGKKNEDDHEVKLVGSTGSTKQTQQKQSGRSRKLSQTIDKNSIPNLPRLSRDLDD